MIANRINIAFNLNPCGLCTRARSARYISALVLRFVAEDVAVYNQDIVGGRMRDLLHGLTSTLPHALPSLYRMLEVRPGGKIRGMRGFSGTRCSMGPGELGVIVYSHIS